MSVIVLRVAPIGRDFSETKRHSPVGVQMGRTSMKTSNTTHLRIKMLTGGAFLPLCVYHGSTHAILAVDYFLKRHYTKRPLFIRRCRSRGSVGSFGFLGTRTFISLFSLPSSRFFFFPFSFFKSANQPERFGKGTISWSNTFPLGIKRFGPSSDCIRIAGTISSMSLSLRFFYPRAENARG